jgi:hypothetical protein
VKSQIFKALKCLFFHKAFIKIVPKKIKIFTKNKKISPKKGNRPQTNENRSHKKEKIFSKKGQISPKL